MIYTKIEVGKKYLNKQGLLMEVVLKRDEFNYEVKDATERCFLSGYIVNPMGKFGNTSNHYDLITN